MPTPIVLTRIRCACSVLAVLLVHSSMLWAQQPAAPPPPPPRLEASAQFTFLDTRGNAESEDELSSRSVAAYKLAISSNSEFASDPRFLQPFSDANASKFDHTAALNVALNSILSLKLSHILRYSAEPPVGFDSTDSITAVSLVAKILRPQ